MRPPMVKLAGVAASKAALPWAAGVTGVTLPYAACARTWAGVGAALPEGTTSQ